jgi:hypothetical protein
VNQKVLKLCAIANIDSNYGKIPVVKMESWKQIQGLVGTSDQPLGEYSILCGSQQYASRPHRAGNT